MKRTRRTGGFLPYIFLYFQAQDKVYEQGDEKIYVPTEGAVKKCNTSFWLLHTKYLFENYSV